MKFIIYIFWGLVFTSCKNYSSVKHTDKENSMVPIDSTAQRSPPTYTISAELLSDSVSLYRIQLTDTLKEDMNCDGLPDQVFFSDKPTSREIVFIDGKTKEEKILGKDIPVKGDLGADYKWVDLWGITKDTSSWESLVEDGELIGSRRVTLRCPSIVLRKEEVGGGIITFKDNSFVWVHQSD